eukprot:6312407-Amphidinium_carterae.1
MVECKHHTSSPVQSGGDAKFWLLQLVWLICDNTGEEHGILWHFANDEGAAPCRSGIFTPCRAGCSYSHAQG